MPAVCALCHMDSEAAMQITLKTRSSPMARGQSLQDPFFNALRKERVPVSIYLVNGIKLQGQIDSFDQFVVLLQNSVSQMVYKHAISTVGRRATYVCRPVKTWQDGDGAIVQ